MFTTFYITVCLVDYLTIYCFSFVYSRELAPRSVGVTGGQERGNNSK